MEKKNMSRREAIRAMMLAGAGLAAGNSLAAMPLRKAGILPAEQKFVEPAKGDQVIHRNWPSLGESISLLGMGCMRFPRKPGAGRRAPLDQEAVNQMIDYALEHGINYFDTAPAYGDSERATGEALSRHNRKDYLIATKMSNF
ncbi:MAG: aldo/keto reductase, partial [Bacteroidales bacterium]|nr:aldo/keto reductase [Bacteroidales bacterium]